MDSSDSETLLKQFNVSRESQERLHRYVSALLHWQNQINLIGSSTVATVWKRHILDSLQLLPLLRRQFAHRRASGLDLFF